MEPLQIVCHPQAELAESPVWDENTKSLYFVDIKQKKLHNTDLSGTLKTWKLTDQTGAIALTEEDHLIAAQQDRFIEIHLSPFKEKTITTITGEPPHNRFNDGKCDPQGRFWAATMDDHCLQSTGSIWSLNSKRQIQRHHSGYTVGNGFGWNRAADRLYFTDSENRTIYYWSYSPDQGALLGTRILFANIPEPHGLPDGLCIDAEDHIWSAHWGGHRITRYRPDGTIERTIPVPVPRPTSITFGGEDLTTLLITTAQHGLDSSTLEQYPLSGAILSLQVDVAGLPAARFPG